MFGQKNKKSLAVDMGSLVKRHEIESGRSEDSDGSDHITQVNHIAKVIGASRKSPAAQQSMTPVESK